MNYKKIAEKIEIFIKEKITGLNGGVIGISGGLDSTIVAYLAVNALGAKKVCGMIMPYKENQNTIDGIETAEILGINYNLVNIKPIVDVFEKTGCFDDKLPKGNLMARVRMCLLYGMANQKNLLVLGTSNKTEIQIGYFTKYGDGGVDIEPIGDLYKTEVRALARYLSIPDKIVNKKPTADLWKGQTDEGEIGISYGTLDAILRGDIKEQVLHEKVQKMIEKSEHKRRMPIIFKAR